MRILVAGAGGAVGRALLPALVAKGHEVIGMTRSKAKAASVRSTGAQHVAADALDAKSVLRVVEETKPDAIIEQLTSIPAKLNLRRFDEEFAETNRLRTTGTDNLVAAAQAFGIHRFVAQSFGGWPYTRTGGPVKTEVDPLDPDPPSALRNTLNAIRHLEEKVTTTPGLEGIALRYGFFYGPVKTVGGIGTMVEDVRRRRIPVVGSGAGVWSFIHIDDVASATVAALERGASGLYNIADDEPAAVSVWLPAMAEMLEAKPPLHIPAWLARPMIGKAGVVFMTETRGASNAKAKRSLGWKPKWPTWREGFRQAFLR